MLFFDVTLPVFLVAGIGYAAGRLSSLDIRSIGSLVFVVFGPALIFRSVYTANLASDHAGRIILFVALLHIALFVAARVLARLRSWDEDTAAVAGLAVTLGNYGTYALPVILFAFGEAGLDHAVIFFVSSVLIQATLGVGVAAWRRGQPPWRALGSIFRVPWVYAFLVAFVMRLAGWQLPEALLRPMELVAAGAIPMQLLLLGMELSRLNLRAMQWKTLEISLVRVLLAPAVAIALSAAIGLIPAVAAIVIVQASMPSAINSMILAVRYERRPELAAGVVLVTTVLSLGTLTLVLVLAR